MQTAHSAVQRKCSHGEHTGHDPRQVCKLRPSGHACRLAREKGDWIPFSFLADKRRQAKVWKDMEGHSLTCSKVERTGDPGVFELVGLLRALKSV